MRCEAVDDNVMRLRWEREQTLLVDPWLDGACTAQQLRGIIRDALSAEADGGPATGLRASRVEGRLAITQRWLLARG